MFPVSPTEHVHEFEPRTPKHSRSLSTSSTSSSTSSIMGSSSASLNKNLSTPHSTKRAHIDTDDSNIMQEKGFIIPKTPARSGKYSSSSSSVLPNRHINPITPKTPHSSNGSNNMSHNQRFLQYEQQQVMLQKQELSFSQSSKTTSSSSSKTISSSITRTPNDASSTSTFSNPLFTPEATPRRSTRRPITDSYLFSSNDVLSSYQNLPSTNSSGSSFNYSNNQRPSCDDKFGKLLFPVAKSTIGSGRKSHHNRKDTISGSGNLVQPIEYSNSVLMTPKSIAKSSIIDSPSFIQEEVEEEEEEEENDEEHAIKNGLKNPQEAEMTLIVPKGRKAPKKRVTSRQLTFSSDSEEDETSKYATGEQANIVLKEDITIFNSVIPSTPKGKLITEEMARKWHNDSYFKEEGSHDNHDDYYSPFINNKSNVLNYKANKNNSIFDGNKKKSDFSRYENEVEYIDKRTGEKIFVAMDDFQKSIKPKRLVFSNDNTSSNANQSTLSVPSTPKRQIKEKVLKKLNIKNLMDKQMTSDESNYNDDDDEYYEDEDSEFKVKDDISSDEIIKKGDFKNIFYNGPKKSLSVSQKDKSLEHTITYINHQTGVKTVKEMDRDQLNIKPKTLCFDGLISDDEDIDELKSTQLSSETDDSSFMDITTTTTTHKSRPNKKLSFNVFKDS